MSNKFRIGDKVKVTGTYSDGSGREYLAMTGVVVSVLGSTYVVIDNGLKSVTLPIYMLDFNTEQNNNKIDMTEELNLCEILSGHEGEVFYSLAHGEVSLIEIVNNDSNEPSIKCNIINTKEGVLFRKDGKMRQGGEVMLFPSRDLRDWQKWVENNTVTYDNVEESIFAEVGITNVNMIVASPNALNKLKAINKLINVQKWIEKGWRPTANNNEMVFYMYYDLTEDNIRVAYKYSCAANLNIPFSSKKNARRAIEILGEDVIKAAISTDW